MTSEDVGVGHNSMAALRGLVERIEHLHEVKDGINDDEKEIYAEAKSLGFSSKAIRKVIALRKRDPEDLMEEEMLIATYREALDV